VASHGSLSILFLLGGDDGMISLLSLKKSLSSRDFIQIIIVHYVHLIIPGDENHICPIDKGGPEICHGCPRPACGKPRGNRNPIVARILTQAWPLSLGETHIDVENQCFFSDRQRLGFPQLMMLVHRRVKRTIV
jgi:hypothetical protein